MIEMKLLIFGPPGSGKGVLSEFIAKETHITHISAGEMIREHIKKGDEIGQLAKDIVEKGQLIPDEITNQMVQERIKEEHSFLLDGYPRDVEQAQFFTGISKVTGVIHLTLAEEKILERLLKRGRADDKEEVIKDRIKLYEDTTKPVLEFLKNKNIPVLEIDGDYDIKTEVNSIIERIVIWQETIASGQ